MKKKFPVLFLVGPTATGKSSLGIDLAKKMNGEIISADSMQIYKYMNIGTAKPSLKERGGVKHHLMDIISPSRSFSVHDFYRRAIMKIESISRRGKTPIVVGGTGLYVRALLQGIDEAPGRDQKMRNLLTAEAKKHGVKAIHDKLKKIAPGKAKRIKQTDLKRIIRAIEIERQRNKGRKKYQKARTLASLGYAPVVIGLNRPREELYKCINRRVDKMFREGLEKEVRGLLKNKVSRTALQAVGYKELVEVIEERSGLSEAKEMIKRNSRRLAKRQITWFKKEEGLKWLQLPSGATKRQILSAALKLLEEFPNNAVRKN